LLAIFILGLGASGETQRLPRHSQPALGVIADSISFYDRLDEVLKTDQLHPDNRDSSFNWMVGTWTIQAKGWARRGFRNKTEFQWREPTVSFMRDQHYSIYAATGDTIQLTGSTGQRMTALPPQVILLYDVHGKVWVLQSGYKDRYDWGYMISEGWNGDRIEFNGAISVSGIRMIERETWVRLSDQKFQVIYEERLSDGRWFKTEENIFTRVAAKD
jgi:hypothetical protein